MKSFFKQPLFWILFTIASGITGILAFYYFPQSNPIIHLNLTMNRNQAIDKARAIALEFALGPTDALHAAQFYTDTVVKTFVELEGGGKDALVTMMEKGLYHPYYWKVRRFKPFEHHEALIYFTPDGIAYGFKETISENTPGTNISSAAAQLNAQTFAQTAPWHVDFTEYTLVETSQEAHPSGRIDHTFTYERINEKIGDGFYRLKILVSGDHISEFSYTVKVPDAFKQRYNQMRSTNDTIAYAATIFMFLFYGIGCCLIGLSFLMQQRFVIWRIPFYWSLFIALLVALNIPNQLPLQWMEYKTAYAPIIFLIEQGISFLYTFILFAMLFAIVFIAAESLSRRAFGHHLQFWQLYHPRIISSYTILGYTISAYLLVPIMLCYTILFYHITLRWFGWWSPSSALFNPNILATYFPWLEPISISLQAGFFEECLFRALPLASAALLGNRFGKRSWWIAGAFILQAIVFGAGHANYPQQPAYARIVELLITSSFFGALYLRFGLLPTIITHFIIDVFWFSLPIFISTAPGSLVNKIIIIFFGLLPLFILFTSRIKTGAWRIIPSSFFNRAWQPTAEKSIPLYEQPPRQPIALQKRVIYTIYFLGIIGFGAWGLYTRFSHDAFSFSTSPNTIATASKQLLQNKNENVDAWYLNLYPFVQYENYLTEQKQHRFVWQKGGKEIYHQLINTYLMPPHWIARFVKFEGPLVDRAEEHEFDFKPDGSFFRHIHTVPQTKPGAYLSLADAQKLALATIAEQFHLKPEELHEISAVADKQPERLDWKITYSSRTDYPLTHGEGRIVIKIAGDKVVDAARSVHIPEEWERTEDNRILITAIIKQLCVLTTWFIIMIGATIALIEWHTHPLLPSLWIFIIVASIFLFELFNSWPMIIAHFNTSQPFYDQFFRSLSVKAILLLLRAAAMAIACSFFTYIPIFYQSISFARSIVCGISLGTLVSGIQSTLIYSVPSVEPTWPSYTPLQFLIPFTIGIDSVFLNYLSLTLLLFACVVCTNKMTHYGRERRILVLIMSLIFGYTGAGLIFASHILLCAISGLLFTLFFYASYFTLLRFDYAIIPILTATYTILQNAQQFFFNGYPLAQLIAIVSSSVIAIIGWLWSKKLHTS